MTTIHPIRSYSREFFMSCPKISFIIAVATLWFLGMLASPASADTVLQVKPLSWNVIGLDSNSPFAGPYRFPVGARVCNIGSSDAG
ncbi:MAG TPA: hypothetical protein VLD55_07390, partial [Candidatus Sulfobium mesophilum]|nr:hypothetical protein [Candidatus Sulfobium mesophilum]